MIWWLHRPVASSRCVTDSSCGVASVIVAAHFRLLVDRLCLLWGSLLRASFLVTGSLVVGESTVATTRGETFQSGFECRNLPKGHGSSTVFFS